LVEPGAKGKRPFSPETPERGPKLIHEGKKKIMEKTRSREMPSRCILEGLGVERMSRWLFSFLPASQNRHPGGRVFGFVKKLLKRQI